jgi:membrane fusion protein (multidrug efflux system)
MLAENLVKQKSVSASELDRLQSSIDTARAHIAQVQATLKDRVIKAPFDGLLGLRNVSAGALLKPGDEITTLDSVTHLQMDFNLAELYIPRIKVGQAIKAFSVAYPDRLFDGEIVTLDSRVNPSTRSIKVRAKINNEQALLRPGMLLTLDLIDQQRITKMLPEETVFMRANKHLVYKVSSDMTVSEQSIEIGILQNGKVEVLSGLELGDKIVWQGLLKVKPGRKVIEQIETWRKDEA